MLHKSPFVAFKLTQKMLRMPYNAFITHHPTQILQNT